jgi:hypothetical protein
MKDLRRKLCLMSSRSFGGKIGTAEDSTRRTIAKDVMVVLNYGGESVSVAIEEIKPEDWADGNVAEKIVLVGSAGGRREPIRRKGTERDEIEGRGKQRDPGVESLHPAEALKDYVGFGCRFRTES